MSYFSELHQGEFSGSSLKVDRLTLRNQGNLYLICFKINHYRKLISMAFSVFGRWATINLPRESHPGEMFMTETTEFAHVLLPTCTFSERVGIAYVCGLRVVSNSELGTLYDDLLEFIKAIASRLDSVGIPYMMTGSTAMAKEDA